MKFCATNTCKVKCIQGKKRWRDPKLAEVVWKCYEYSTFHKLFIYLFFTYLRDYKEQRTLCQYTARLLAVNIEY